MAKGRDYENAILAKTLSRNMEDGEKVSIDQAKQFQQARETIGKNNSLLDISNKYGVSPNALTKANPNTSFSTGVQVRIPTIGGAGGANFTGLQGNAGRPVVQKTFLNDMTPQQRQAVENSGQGFSWGDAFRSNVAAFSPSQIKDTFSTPQGGRASVAQQAAGIRQNERLLSAPNTTYNPNTQVDNRSFWQKTRDFLSGNTGQKSPSNLTGVQGNVLPERGSSKTAALAQSAISPYARGIQGRAGGVGNKVMQNIPITNREIWQNNLQAAGQAFTPQNAREFLTAFTPSEFQRITGTPQGRASVAQQAAMRQQQGAARGMRSVAQSAISPFARNNISGSAGGVGNKIMQNIPITRSEIWQNNMQAAGQAFTPQNAREFLTAFTPSEFQRITGTPQGRASVAQQAAMQQQQQQGAAKGMRSPTQGLGTPFAGVQGQAGGGNANIYGDIVPSGGSVPTGGYGRAQGTEVPSYISPNAQNGAPLPTGGTDSLLPTSAMYDPRQYVNQIFQGGQAPSSLPKEAWDTLSPDERKALNGLYMMNPKTGQIELSKEGNQVLNQGKTTMDNQDFLKPRTYGNGWEETAQEYYQRTGRYKPGTPAERFWIRQREQEEINQYFTPVSSVAPEVGTNVPYDVGQQSSNWRI